MKYYIAQNGQPVGPFEPNELLQHGLTANSQVWNESMTGWMPANQVPELAPLLTQQTYQQYQQPIQQVPQQPQYVQQPAYQQPQPQYAAQPQQPQYGGAPQQQYGQPYGVQQQPMGVMPDTHMVGAILVTLFCCLPFGVIAIIKASNVSSCYNRGDYNGAVQSSNEAKKWINWSLLGGIVYLIFVIIYFIGVIGIASSGF